MENKHILLGLLFVAISFIAAYLVVLTPTMQGIPGFSSTVFERDETMARYEIKRESITYQDALEASNALGGTLATPGTPNEFNRLVRILEDSEDADCFFITGYAFDEETTAYISPEGEQFILFQYLDRDALATPGTCLVLHVAPNNSSHWQFVPLPKEFGIRLEYHEKTAYILEFPLR